MNQAVLDGINQQIKMESQSSNIYLAMASWADCSGYEGMAEFLYTHADEEREHMMKLVNYVNERGGKVVIPGLEAPRMDYESVKEVFESVLKHEILVSEEINKLVGLTLKEADHITHNFLQWFVSEQIEEEKLARLNIDRLNLVGSDKGGLYLFDRDLKSLHQDMQKKDKSKN